jgi:hypothetical protein
MMAGIGAGKVVPRNRLCAPPPVRERLCLDIAAKAIVLAAIIAAVNLSFRRYLPTAFR